LDWFPESKPPPPVALEAGKKTLYMQIHGRDQWLKWTMCILAKRLMN
jgi:hypothetical protein